MIWQDWIAPAPPSALSPYADWWQTVDPALVAPDDLALYLAPGAGMRRVRIAPVPMARSDLGQDIDAELGAAFASLAPLPAHARPPGGPVQNSPDLVPALSDPPGPDAVIVGVIDTAIALCHERFRHAGGDSRILAAWQMTAPYPAEGQPGHGRSAYGREVWQGEIRDALTAVAGEEPAANRLLGLVDYAHAEGDRALDLGAYHGTQVADLATGYDPHDDTHEASRRAQPILAVSLPSNQVLGSSGTFLQYFVIHAIEWLTDRADAIWNAHFPDQAGRGFPIVINLSYGLAAGPKDGTLLVEAYARRLMAERTAAGRAPLRIVLPAGNDNLERGHAELTLGPAAPQAELTWRLPPQDPTSSHVEVWLPGMAVTDPTALPLLVDLIPPGGAAPAATGPVYPGMHRDLLDGNGAIVARLYVRWGDPAPFGAGPDAGPPHRRMMLLICIAPTHSHRPGAATAPSGGWTIRITQTDGVSRRVHLYVQSERPLRPTQGEAPRSYFDHPAYRIYDAAGHPIDSFDLMGEPREPLNVTGPVQRKGTINALASLDGATVVTGHRESDKVPAPWASTGPGYVNGNGGRMRASPTLSLPCDEGAGHPGVLAAGNGSGSAVAMQGTSFSAPLAARQIVADLRAAAAAADPAIQPPAWWVAARTNAALISAAKAAETVLFPPGSPKPKPTLALKIGAGRLDAPATGRPPRRTPG